MANTGIWSRTPLLALGRLTAIALLGAGLTFAVLLFTIFLSTGTIVIALTIVTIVLLLAGGAILTGVRWTPVLGIMMGLGTFIGGVLTQQYFVYHLTHPGEVWPFFLCLVICVFAAIAIWAGLVSMLQNYRGIDRDGTPWLPIPLVGFGGFVLGALLVAVIVASTGQSVSGASTTGANTTVHMGVSTFLQSSVTIHKGTKITLVDDGQYYHIIDNGKWVNNAPQPTKEAGAPTIQNVNVNGNSAEIGPFDTAGTYSIYCTVHPNMNLTIIVQ